MNLVKRDILLNSERIHPSVEVLPATSEDLRPLVDLEEAVALQKYPNPESGITPEDIAAIGWGEERVAKYRERFLENPQARIWVAKENGQVVGYTAAVKNKDGRRVWKLYVAGNTQGRGVGSKLLAQAEDWLGRDEPIWLGIASYDHAALDFYTTHGYEPVGLRPEDQTTVHETGRVIHETLLVKQPA